MAPIHPRLRELIDAGGRSAAPLTPGPGGLAELRAGYARTAAELGGEPQAVAYATDLEIPRGEGVALPARVYGPAGSPAPAPAIVWFHGGGFVIGDLDGADRVARALAVASGAVVLSVDYRLAPEHPFPAAAADGEAALRWATGAGAAELDIDPGRVAVAGDSAGGHVAVQAALRAPGSACAQLLAYPALDPLMESDSYAQFAGGPMLTAAEMAGAWSAYLGGGDAAAASVMHAAGLAGAPPARVAVAGHDPLRDDGLAYAQALRAAGVRAEVRVFDDMTHGFIRWGGVVERAQELIAWLAQAHR